MKTAPMRFLAFFIPFALAATTGLGQTNVVPSTNAWADDFEIYTNQTPLTGGVYSLDDWVTVETNGWYGSTINVMVQNAVSYQGNKAAIIPFDATLQNKIVGEPNSNVWVQFYINAQLYDGEYYPDVDTNLASFFFVNSNGFFVVPDGMGEFEPNWVILSNTAAGDPADPVLGGNDFLRVDVFHNYTNRTWSLFANTEQLADGLGFLNTNQGALQEFSLYNGATTTYLDNVKVEYQSPSDIIPDLSVSSTEVVQKVHRGGNAENQTFGVWTENTFFQLRYTTTVVSGSGWLTLSPGTGVTIGETNLVTNLYAFTYSLMPGVHTSRVVVSGVQNGFVLYKSLDVKMQVMEIKKSVTDLAVEGVVGHDADQVSFTVWNGGAGEMNYNISANVPWMRVLTTNGQTNAVSSGPDQVNEHVILFESALLEAGKTYEGLVTIQSPDGGGAQSLINVSLIVNQRPALGRTPSVLTNVLTIGSSGTNYFEVFKNSGGGGITYAMISDSKWLSVIPAIGSSSAEHDPIQVRIASSLNVGEYRGRIRITAVDSMYGEAALGSPQEVDVLVRVEQPAGIAVNPLVLAQQALQGSDASNMTFDVWNSGGGTLLYSASDNVPWMVIENASGSAGSLHKKVTVRFSTAALAQGAHLATITITGTDASGNVLDTKYLPVQLHVMPIATLMCDTAGLTNEVLMGQAAGAKTFRVRNGSDQPIGRMAYSMSAQYSTGKSAVDDLMQAGFAGARAPVNNWLSFSPLSGSSTGEWDTITVFFDSTGLVPGEYNASIVVSATDAGTGDEAVSSPQTVFVTLKVKPTKPGDIGGEGRTALVVYYEALGSWYIQTLDGETLANGFSLGGLGYRPLLGDFDGDGTIELCAYREASGNWYVMKLDESKLVKVANWGGSGFEPVVGDFDGDGSADIAVYSSTGEWFIQNAAGKTLVWGLSWGGPGLIPVSGDFDGDNITDLALYQESSGQWFIMGLNREVLAWAELWGGANMRPVSGDFNGDGLDDMCVYDAASGNWYARTLAGKTIVWAANWGGAGFEPVSGDYDGDGVNDLAVYHNTSGRWYIVSLNGTRLLWGKPWGGPGFAPVGGR